ncbi:MAG: nucleotidyltransferase family protein [archaeon]
MKAFLLAAGLGTRLRPLTNTTPKCLIPVSGKPLLGWWVELMEEHGIDEVLLNLHHLPAKVEQYIRSYPTRIKFRLFYEEKLLGSAGTLKANRDFVNNSESFFILYADNLTNYNLTDFYNFHLQHKEPFSMALFHTNNPKGCGIAVTDENGIIVDFEEKPENPKTDLANAGMYIADSTIFDLIPEYEITDIGYHLLPKLVGRMAGWKTDDYLIDIGTIENLRKAEHEWSQIKKRSL